MPKKARPPESSLTEAMAAAATAGWRVSGLVTVGPSITRRVDVAATARDTYSSRARDWESAMPM